MALDPVVVFVARVSPRDAPEVDVANDWLRQSLDTVVRSYEMEYGLGSRPPRFYTFVHNCCVTLIQSGPHFQYFTGLIKECEQDGSDLILVLRGWDAITADHISFYYIFARCLEVSINVSMKVFDSDPRLNQPFFSVNILKACSVIKGELEPEDAAVERHTQLFIVKTGQAYMAEFTRGMDPARLQVSSRAPLIDIPTIYTLLHPPSYRQMIHPANIFLETP